MNTVIDANDVFRKFDFSSIITKEDNDEAIRIVNQIIADGNYFKNSPPYQTQENIFQRPEAIWLKYRMSFIFSVFMYLGREVRVSELMAWSFKTNLSTVEDRDSYWHHHHHRSDTKMLSGIFYLHIPDDVSDYDTCGTEMAPNGPEDSNKFFVRPSEYTWLMYPSDQWHRPGIVQSDQYRFVLAADIVYN
jgi:hypothetical protein